MRLFIVHEEEIQKYNQKILNKLTEISLGKLVF